MPYGPRRLDDLGILAAAQRLSYSLSKHEPERRCLSDHGEDDQVSRLEPPAMADANLGAAKKRMVADRHARVALAPAFHDDRDILDRRFLAGGHREGRSGGR